jgi:hypothetical protein
MQNPQPHIEDMWKKMKLQHKYNKVVFALLKMTLNNDFFKGKIRMNPSMDPPSNEFNHVFKYWISKSTNKNPHIGPMCHESHYRVNPLLEFDSLKDVVDGSLNVEFLSSKSRRIFVVFSTMNSLNEDPNICSQTGWKSVLLSMLSMKVAFKAVVCICNQKSFNNLVITL